MYIDIGNRIIVAESCIEHVCCQAFYFQKWYPAYSCSRQRDRSLYSLPMWRCCCVLCWIVWTSSTIVHHVWWKKISRSSCGPAFGVRFISSCFQIISHAIYYSTSADLSFPTLFLCSNAFVTLMWLLNHSRVAPESLESGPESLKCGSRITLEWLLNH